MGKPSPPAPPNPTQVAQAQSTANQQTAELQSQLNNGNSYGPYGSVTNVQSPGTNQWTQTTTLSPAEQQIFNQGTQAQGAALGIANDQLGRVAGALGTPLQAPELQTSVGSGYAPPGFPGSQTGGYGLQTGGYGAPSMWQGAGGAQPYMTSGGAPGGYAGQAMSGLYGANPVANTVNSEFGAQMGLLAPQMQQAQEQQNANLVAQGLNPNDAAWQNSQTLFNNAQGQELAQVANNAVQGGNAEQQALYGENLSSGQFGNQALQQMFGNQATVQNEPINQFDALMSSNQVQSPSVGQFAQTGVAPTDVLGAYALSQQQQNANYQAQMQQYNSGLGGLFNLGSSALMAFA